VAPLKFSDVRTNPWVWLSLATPVVSFLILLWAKTSPGYDPYGWLVWGYQTLHGSLNLHGAPSWKPITYLFTLPYSLFGHLSWWLWRITALSFALVGPVVGGRIAYRLVRREEDPQWPAVLAALVAGAGVVMIVQYWHYVLSSQSDPMLVTFTLIAFDQWLSRRYGWAVTFLVATGLGRPEDWIVLGPLGLWVLFTQPRLRGLMIFYAVLMAFLWFGIPVLSGAPWNVAQKLAQHSVRELHHNQFAGTLQRYLDLSEWPFLVTAAVTAVWAAVRRDLGVLAAVGLVVAWMAVEEWFVISNGFPGVPRYMFEAAAMTVVVGGIGVGWLAQEAWRAGPLVRRLPAALVVLVLLGSLVPDARAGWDWEHRDIVGQRVRTQSITELHATIQALGGPRFVDSCGVPTVDVGTASILAWYTHLSTAHVGYIPARQIRRGGPVVLFTGLFNGFAVHTYNLHGARARRCARLYRAYYIVTREHPGGELLHLSH
jgi:hypothetical protein